MWQKIKNVYHLIRAYLACLYFGFPSKKLKVIGVTGTDGKTSTSHMIYEIFKNAGKKVALISSIHAIIGAKTYDTGFHVTTPDPVALQKFLKKIVKAGSEYLILEVTSHGLDQNRVFGISFEVAVLTNITHEHLDYHKTYDNYLKAKAKLFKQAKISVLNADDDSFGKIKKLLKGKIVSYSITKNADFTLKNMSLKLPIPGDYNLSNALAAAAATSHLGIDKNTIRKALSNFKSVKGRMEKVNLGQDFTAIVDFAHTPNGLEQALRTLRSLVSNKKSSRLTSVFGAAGERDEAKRPLMGEISAKLADYTVITAEDPRTESAQEIASQIAKGCQKAGAIQNKNYFIIPDREKAIDFAINNLAQKGDIVATFGKSHEKSMCYGKTEYPWDEFQAVKKALKRRLASVKK